MMDPDERALFVQAVAGAIALGDDGLEAIGWSDALAEDPRAAISVWFEAQGLVNGTSEALQLVMLRNEDRHGTSQVVWGRLALSHELIGASRAMLSLAREHALERVQFGGPIASFQAVRHRLAETLVAIEAAQAAVDGAWIEGTELAASVAKAVAGRSARTTAKHCQQVLAGIGFTTEHPFHRYFSRVLELDHQLGDYRTLTRQLGEQLLTERALPTMLPL